MSEDFEHSLDIEEQRMRTQESLRTAKKALVVTVDEKGEFSILYMNVTQIEYRGLLELLTDTAPKWEPTRDED